MPTQAEVAVHLDLSARSVRELRDAGAIPDPAQATLDELRVAYLRHMRTVAAGRTTSGPLDPRQERAALDQARREAQELRNAQERGELVPGDDLQRTLVHLAMATRSRILAVPSKLAQALAAAESPAQAHKIVEEALCEALEELADEGERAQATLDADDTTTRGPRSANTGE